MNTFLIDAYCLKPFQGGLQFFNKNASNSIKVYYKSNMKRFVEDLIDQS